MNQVPKMISTKDLSYISDMFEWNFTVSKVCKSYEEKIETEDIKTIIGDIGRMHANICARLVEILGGNYGQQ